ncbi:hypothetical protein [Gordonia terrae]|uniref:hypothetical protein n=1 Tax=Gordonia terrae TaxID=2055 RepID=UPI003CC807E0
MTATLLLVGQDHDVVSDLFGERGELGRGGRIVRRADYLHSRPDGVPIVGHRFSPVSTADVDISTIIEP